MDDTSAGADHDGTVQSPGEERQLSGREIAGAVRHQLYRHAHQLIDHHDPRIRSQVIEDWTSWLWHQRDRFSSWEHAWNAFAADGVVYVTPPRCFTCNGRGWSEKSMARTGQLMCHTCRGNRRGQRTAARVQAARIPEQASVRSEGSDGQAT